MGQKSQDTSREEERDHSQDLQKSNGGVLACGLEMAGARERAGGSNHASEGMSLPKGGVGSSPGGAVAWESKCHYGRLTRVTGPGLSPDCWDFRRVQTAASGHPVICYAI